MPCFRHCFPGIKRDLKEKNYSRLSIISDFHYPCKKIGHAERTPALYGCQRRGPAGYERLARPRSGRLYGRYVQRNGDAEEYRLVRLVVNGLKKRKASLPAIMNCSIRATAKTCGPAAVPNESCILPAIPRPSGPLYYAKEQRGYLLVFLSPDTVTGGAAVELSHQQLTWLDQTLAAHRQMPTIIFCHAP